ncbi:MAG: glycerate kinase [Desulfobacterales bacterium]
MKCQSKKTVKLRKDAEKIFYAGLAAVEPGAAIHKFCRHDNDTLYIGNKNYDLSRFDRVYVIGAGKAAAPMATAIEEILEDKISGGIITVKYGHLSKSGRINVIEAGHPIPDQNGRDGAESILSLAEGAGKNDLVICLISGGGSALLPLPAEGITLKDKQDAIKVLLSCGASIDEVNSIRKHISGIKGGMLARAAYPATLVSLILSDVVGDDLDVIASGPSIPDSSTYEDCMGILSHYNISDSLPEAVYAHICKGASGLIPETPKPGDPVFKKTASLIIGSNMEAITSAKKKAEEIGYNTIVLSSMIEGETKHVARVHAAIAKEIRKTGNPLSPPACILSGGETTVTITGNGRGGRNQEFSLAAALDIATYQDIVVFSAGTDGTDGPTDAAGAVADTTTVKRALEKKIDPVNFLLDNDSYNFFRILDDLVITGPTNTNVMDLRIILVA